MIISTPHLHLDAVLQRPVIQHDQ